MIPLHKIAKEKLSLEEIDIKCLRYLRYLGYDRFKKSLRSPGTWDLRYGSNNRWERDVGIRNFTTQRQIDLPPYSNTWIIE